MLEDAEPGGVGARFLQRQQPSLEAQLCNLADEMAYNAHDIDDGVRSGLISLEQLQEVVLFNTYRLRVQDEFPKLSGRRLLYETIRRMLSDQVYDVMDTTRAALTEYAPASADHVRLLPPLVRFSPGMRAASTELKHFLLHSLYRHPQVLQTTEWARQVVSELFNAYMNKPQAMPDSHANRSNLPRAVSDYIAGMTDRFATKEHTRLTA
jgi:dGTPase